MEQKKLLWIAVIVGVFLLVITGTAFLLYGDDVSKTLTVDSPSVADVVWTPSSNNKEENMFSDSWDSLEAEKLSVTNPLENVLPPVSNLGSDALNDAIKNNDQSVAQVADTSLETSTITNETSPVEVHGETTISTLNVETLKVDTIQANTIDVRRLTGLTSKKRPNNSSRTEKTAQENSTRVSTKQAEAKSQDVATIAKSNSTTKEVSKKDKTGKTVAEPTTKTMYWIQAGSLTDKLKAEEARTELSKKLISPEIFTREINGTTYYRLRIGPYKNKEEATFWLAKVQTLKGFEGSYISQTE